MTVERAMSILDGMPLEVLKSMLASAAAQHAGVAHLLEDEAVKIMAAKKTTELAESRKIVDFDHYSKSA